MKQTLPTATWTKGRWELAEPFDRENRITCEAYGQMQTGEMVWQDGQGRQYLRARFFGKYYFVKL